MVGLEQDVCFDGGWSQSAARVLRNTTLERWEAHGSPAIGVRPGEGEQTGATASGEAIYVYENTAPRIGFSGDIEPMCLYAGMGVGKITDLPSAGDLVRQLRKEMITM